MITNSMHSRKPLQRPAIMQVDDKSQYIAMDVILRVGAMLPKVSCLAPHFKPNRGMWPPIVGLL